MSRFPVHLGPLEMEVLGLLDAGKSLSVHEACAGLEARGRSLAYTTVLTILGRLYEKGLLEREKQGRQYLYRQAKQVAKVRSGIWSKVYRSLFQNDRLKPILALIDDKDGLTPEELAELQDYIADKLKNRRDTP